MSIADGMKARALAQLPSRIGEFAPLRGIAPGFHVLADIYNHTDLDIPELVPEAGIEATVRAYAKIIDDVNRVDLR